MSSMATLLFLGMRALSSANDRVLNLPGIRNSASSMCDLLLLRKFHVNQRKKLHRSIRPGGSRDPSYRLSCSTRRLGLNPVMVYAANLRHIRHLLKKHLVADGPRAQRNPITGRANERLPPFNELLLQNFNSTFQIVFG